MDWLKPVLILIGGLAMGFLINWFSPKYIGWIIKEEQENTKSIVTRCIKNIILCITGVLALLGVYMTYNVSNPVKPGYLIAYVTNSVDRPAKVATVTLFHDNWEYIGEKTTTDSGRTDYWQDLEPGDYYLIAQSPSTGGSYWGTIKSTILEGSVNEAIISRYMPYILQLPGILPKIHNQESHDLEVEIVNKDTVEHSVRLEILIDRDMKEPWDDQITQIKPIIGNSSDIYTLSYTPERNGHYFMALKVYTYLPWDNKYQWVQTDHFEWDYEFDVINN